MTTGIFNSGQITQDLASKSFAATIARFFPNGQAPLFGLTSMLPTSTALQAEHGFFTKTMLFPQLTLSAAGQTAADTIFTVLSTANIIPGMMLRADATGENILVLSVVSPVSVAVQRAVGSTAAAAITASTNLYSIGSAFEEGSLRPNALAINPVKITNYTQIFRNTWAITDSARQTMMIAGDSSVAENQRDCAAFHAADMEKALFFGQKFSGMRNGQPFRTMEGIYAAVSNLANYPPSYSSPNVTIAGATTNYTQFEAAFDPCFNQTTNPKISNERTLFVGGTARRVINNIGRLNGTYQMMDGQTSWGLQYATIRLARGNLHIIEHPLFNTNASWSRLAIAVDLDSFNIAYLGDRRTQSKQFNLSNDPNDVSDNGVDAVGGTLTTELTVELKNPPAFGILSNLTAAATG